MRTRPIVRTPRMRWTAKRTKCSREFLHASKAEARRCEELHLLQAAGKIDQLEAHPPKRIPLEVRGQLVAYYWPDFTYRLLEHDCVNREDPPRIVEDVKGNPGDTAIYRLKRKLVWAIYGIRITEVRSCPQGRKPNFKRSPHKRYITL